MGRVLESAQRNVRFVVSMKASSASASTFNHKLNRKERWMQVQPESGEISNDARNFL